MLGKNLPKGLEVNECTTSEICLDFGNAARFTVEAFDDTCYDLHWVSKNYLKSFKDCFAIDSKTHWYGGPEEDFQHFPLNDSNNRDSVPYLPGDMLQDKDKYFGGVAEPYWLSSKVKI